jgi:quercetin dioxygenase-like cupin family protein
MAKDSATNYFEVSNMHGGKGTIKGYVFFAGKADPAMFFAEMIGPPGAYAGYHQHIGHDSILYVVSGKVENFQEGKSEIVGPGEAILCKSGQAHVVRCIGDEDARVVEFCAAHGGTIDPETQVKVLPMPSECADW